jgi:predicted nucleic acid-binding Zn ribbon protein
MAKQDHKSKFNSGAEVLQNLFSDKQGPVADQFLRWKLWMNWQDIVGPTTAQCCEPVSFHQGVLWLWVKNSTWMTQLNFMSETIKNTINQKFSQNMVKEIRLTMDRKNVPHQNDEDFKNKLHQFFKK